MRPSEILDLEDHLFRGWPPARIETVGGWRCGLDRGVTRRPNSVWAFAWDDAVPLDAAIERVETLYRDAGLRPCFRIREASEPAGLETALVGRGYAAEGHSHVLTAALTSMSARGDDIEVAAFGAPSDIWLACYEADLSGARERMAVRGLLARAPAPRLFVATVTDGVATSAALAVSTGEWVQISAVRTLPDWRRRGLAQAVVAAMTRWAGAQGAKRLALQVDATNDPALALYRKAGFRHAYDYHYRARP
jgi:GNAT superfamily N-acetyltransferase